MSRLVLDPGLDTGPDTDPVPDPGPDPCSDPGSNPRLGTYQGPDPCPETGPGLDQLTSQPILYHFHSNTTN